MAMTSINGKSIKDLCGWRPDEERIADFNALNPRLSMQAGHLLATERRDVHLWNAIMAVMPGWRRGAQAIGDCALPWARVQMADGSTKKIADVQEGDYVISASSNVRRVVGLINKPYDAEIVRLNLQGARRDLEMTPDHEIGVFRDGEVATVPMEQITEGDYVVCPPTVDESRTFDRTFDMADYCPEPVFSDTSPSKRLASVHADFVRSKRTHRASQVRRMVRMNEDLAWLLGLYAAEGSVDIHPSGVPGRITFNLGKNRDNYAQRVIDALDRVFGITATASSVPSKPSVVYVRVTSVPLASLFASLCPGNVYTKTVSDDITTASLVNRQAFVRGWLDGDGSFTDNGCGCGSTSSAALADKLDQIFQSLGLEVNWRTMPADSDRKESYRAQLRQKTTAAVYASECMPAQGWGDQHRLAPQPFRSSCEDRLADDLQVVLREVVGVERFHHAGRVHCITVEEDHTFICNGVQVSNCVSWGSELVVTNLMCLKHVKGQGRFIAEAATEAIYGGCRVEALGKSRGGRSDGAFGAAAAKWVRDWGVILRTDMSQLTGIDEHDLREYSGQKAKDWGDYGCGGRRDGGKLDTAAKEMPVQHVVGVSSVEEAAAAIQNMYPITIASMAGFGDMRRDSNGICRRRGQWAHQMCVLGIRWRAGQPEFRVFQSWGPRSCSGPDPGIHHPAISGCSWWITPEDMAWILRTGDCWIHGDVHGLPPQNLEITRPASYWFQKDRPITYELAV